MKKQHLHKKLRLQATRISKLSNLQHITGGLVAVRHTENPCYISDMDTCQTVTEPIKITEAIRCTHTVGNGLDVDGSPCTY